MSGRRNQTDVREASNRGLLSKSAHYNTLARYLEKKELTPYLKGRKPYIAFRPNATAGNRRRGSVWKRLFLQYQT